MNPLRYACPTCPRIESKVAGRPCFFCDTAAKVASFQHAMSPRADAFQRNRAAHEVKRTHRHIHSVTRGKQKG